MSNVATKTEQFDTAQLEYTQMIRWGRFDDATVWVAEDAAEEFLAQSAAQENLRVTDYKVLRTNLNNTEWTATVIVRYELHLLDQLINKTVTEKQSWQFNTTANRWEVNTNLFEVIGEALKQH